MGDLFTSLAETDHHRDLAWVGYYGGEAGLAMGLAGAAEAILSAWQDGAQSNDRLRPPFAYNYRHALELALKQARAERGHGTGATALPSLPGTFSS